MKYILDERIENKETKQPTDKNEGNIYYEEDKQGEQMEINLNTEEKDNKLMKLF